MLNIVRLLRNYSLLHVTISTILYTPEVFILDIECIPIVSNYLSLRLKKTLHISQFFCSRHHWLDGSIDHNAFSYMSQFGK